LKKEKEVPIPSSFRQMFAQVEAFSIPSCLHFSFFSFHFSSSFRAKRKRGGGGGGGGLLCGVGGGYTELGECLVKGEL